MLSIKSFIVTDMQTNSYVVTDVSTGQTAFIDPGEASPSMIELVTKYSLSGCVVKYVLLTHGHFDHIGGANELAKEFNAKIVLGKKEKEFLFDENLNLSNKYGRIKIEPFEADILLDDKEKLSLGKTEIEFIATPGHTIGSGCYIIDDTIFSGDTLFCRTVGRTDLPTSSVTDMANSINRIKNLKDNYFIYPGHGMSTTLEYERKNNPHMQ